MRVLTAAAALVASSFAIQLSGAQPDVSNTGTLIDRARNLLSAGATPEQSAAGLLSLVDALAELSNRVDAPPAFRAHILAAREGLRAAKPAGDKTASIALREAHRVLHGGTGVVAAPPGGDLEALVAATQARLATARRLFDNGQLDASVRALLDAALMIVTPAAPDE